jgi:16S rRNA (guanine966-N2)-methyltransferase
LRIISGYARGLKLKGPHGQAIRPTSDRAREALFNILGNRVRDALVLDLFAGTGALGLEALSRGARHVTFVDNNPDALILIKKNLLLLQKTIPTEPAKSVMKEEEILSFYSQQPASIIRHDLRRESFYSGHLNPHSCFNLIFLDPPYEKGLSLQVLAYLDTCDFLTEHGLLVAEDSSGIELPGAFDTLTIADKRRYGDTAFWFYKNFNPDTDKQ